MAEMPVPEGPPGSVAPSPVAVPQAATPTPGTPVAASPAAAAPKSAASTPTVKSTEPEFPPVSRLQMLEFLSSREWWSYSQRSLAFTFFLWVWFIVLMYTRADVEALFRVHNAVAQHVQQLVAHPSVSGVPLYSQAETPMPCRCSCQLTSASPRPATPCEDSAGNKLFNFMGTLPSDLSAPLLQAHQGVLGPGAAVPAMTWDGIRTLEDAWFWVEHGLLPDVWGLLGNQPVRRPGLLLRRNLMVGGVRARQQRAQLTADCQVPSTVRAAYGASCRLAEPQTAAYGAAAGGGADATGGAFSPAAAGPSAASAEDGDFDAHFDVERPLDYALATAKALRDGAWLGPATRELELEALLLNAEAGAYVLLSIKFTLPFHGWVEKTIHVNTFHALLSTEFSWKEYYPELVWLILILVLLLQELFQIGMSVWLGRKLEYFTNMWNYVDWVSIFLGGAIVFFWYVMLADLTLIADQIGALPRAPLAANLDLSSYREAWAGVLDKAKDVYTIKTYHSLCMFWYTTVISARFLKACLGQEKLAMIQTSLSNSFLDVVHFVLIFFVLFTNFVLGGRVLFGDELAAWSTYVQAASSSVRMLLGSSLFDEMYEVAPASATIWFWMFIMTMVFAVMNLLLVIIVDNYLSFQVILGPTLGVFRDIKEWFLDLYWRLDWRKENFVDGEYKACFVDDPYMDLQDGLVGAATLDEEVEVASRTGVLGLKLALAELEDESPEGLVADGHPGTVMTNSLELRKMGCDAMTADHILEKCAEYVEQQKRSDPNKQLFQVRQFVQLLRSHRTELNLHCQAIEQGVEEEQGQLREGLDRMEASVRAALDSFAMLREVGAESLAPPPPGQTGQMKASGAFEHSGNTFLQTKNVAPVTTLALPRRK